VFTATTAAHCCIPRGDRIDAHKWWLARAALGTVTFVHTRHADSVHADSVHAPGYSQRDFFTQREIVSVTQGDFAVYTVGDGPTVLLLLHGGGLAAQSWALFGREAAARVEGCTIVAIDFRGHGDTTAVPETVSLLAHCVRETLAHLKKGTRGSFSVAV
jgi:hypothetical protein